MARRDNAKETILETAVQLASVQGLNGLSIGALADAVKMSKGGISAHFKSKTDLQLAVVERAAQLFHQTVVLPTLRSVPGIQRLYAFSESWLQYLEGQVFAGGCFFTNAILEVDDVGDGQVARAVADAYRQYIAFIERCVQEAMALGELRADLSPTTFTFELHGVALATLVWRSLGTGSAPLQLTREAVNDLIARNRATPV